MAIHPFYRSELCKSAPREKQLKKDGRNSLKQNWISPARPILTNNNQKVKQIFCWSPDLLSLYNVITSFFATISIL